MFGRLKVTALQRVGTDLGSPVIRATHYVNKALIADVFEARGKVFIHIHLHEPLCVEDSLDYILEELGHAHR